MSAGIKGLGQIRDRMKWLEARNVTLAENVANADTPKFTPRDLEKPGLSPRAPALAVTRPGHIATGLGGTIGTTGAARFETRPSGNAVNLEDEMMKIAETHIEHQTLASLYQQSLLYFKTALGRRG